MIVKDAPENFANWVSEKWRYLKNERIAKERIWNECWLAYDSKFGQTWSELEEYRSKRYLPLSFDAVEAVAANLTQGVMPFEDWFMVQGRTPPDETMAKMMESLLRWQHMKSGFRVEFGKLAKAACIFGNVPYAVDWMTDYMEIPDQDKYASQLAYNQMVRSQGGEVPEELSGMPTKPHIKYDGPVLKIGNIFDYVQDMKPSDPKYALRIMRFFRTAAYLESLGKKDPNGYALYDNVEGISNENIYTETSDALQMQLERQIGFNRAPKDMVELLQVEGDFEIEGKLYKNYIGVVANKTRMIRFEPNPFYHGKPTWDLFVLFPEPNETYGRGILEPCLGLQDVTNVRMNQVIDANTLTINPTWKVKRDGVTDLDNTITGPGLFIEMDDPATNMIPLQTPNASALGMQEIGFMMAQFNQITGSQGSFTTEAYKKSATEVNATAQMSMSRQAETIRHIEHSLLIPILEKEIANNQQLMDRPQWIRVVADQGYGADPDTGMAYPIDQKLLQISPDDIAGDFDCVATGAASVAQSQQQLGQAIQLTQAMLAIAPQAIKPTEFVQEMYKLARIRDAWKFVKTPQEIQLEQQQQFAQQLALKQTGMGPSGPGGEGAGPGGPGGPGGPSVPGGVASVSGVSEVKGPIAGGPDQAQLEGGAVGGMG